MSVCVDCAVPLTAKNVSFSPRRCVTCWEAIKPLTLEEQKRGMPSAVGQAILQAWRASGKSV